MLRKRERIRARAALIMYASRARGYIANYLALPTPKR